MIYITETPAGKSNRMIDRGVVCLRLLFMSMLVDWIAFSKRWGHVANVVHCHKRSIRQSPS